MTEPEDRLYAEFTNLPPPTMPRFDHGSLAFMLDPLPAGWTPEEGAARLAAVASSGTDLDAFWYDFDSFGEGKNSPEKGRTAAHFMLTVGDPRWLVALQLAGADIHKPDSWGQPTISLCVITERADVIDLLLDLGADVNVQGSSGLDSRPNDEGVRPLMLAAELNEPGLVKQLHARGAELEARTLLRTAETALLCAIRTQSLASVQTLLELGADPCVLDGFGSNAVRRAIESGGLPILLALFDAGATPVATADGNINMHATDFCESLNQHDMAAGIRAHFARNAAQEALAELGLRHPTP